MNHTFLLEVPYTQRFEPLAVESSSALSGKELEHHICALFDTENGWCDSTGRALEDLETVTSLPLGEILRFTPGYQKPLLQRGIDHASYCLQVVEGPDAGWSLPLYRGREYTVGRSGTDIEINDEYVPAMWGVLSLTYNGFELSVDGESIRLYPGIEYRLGQSVIVFSADRGCEHRYGSEDLIAPISPELPRYRKSWQLLAMIVIPLIAGTAIAWVTGMWLFLLFSLASSAVISFQWFTQRGQSRKYHQALNHAIERDWERAASIHHPGCTNFSCSPQQEVLWLGKTARSPHINHADFKDNPLPLLDEGSLYVGFSSHQPWRIEIHVGDAVLRHFLVQLAAKSVGNVWVSSSLCAEQEEIFRPLLVVPGCLVWSGEQTDDSLPQSWLLISAVEKNSAEKMWQGPCLVVHITRGEVCESLEGITSPYALVLRQKPGAAETELELSRAEQSEWVVPGISGATTHYVDTGISSEVYIKHLSELCRYRGPHKVGSSGGLVSPMASEHPEFAPESIVDSWLEHRYTPALTALLGAGENGEVLVDFLADGPHFLVAGTTGAGKSQVLRALLLSLLYRYSPERLGLVLIDFKGAASLGVFGAVPHTKALISDLEEAEMQRTLKFLRADLHRREQVFRELGVKDFGEYLAFHREAKSVPTFCELLIVVDEFKMLVETIPAAMDELLRVATLGRSLGVHLVLATQRPQGAVSADIRSNIATTVCLRVASAQESMSVLGSDVAAQISSATPGVGFVQFPDGTLKKFRGTYVDAPRMGQEQGTVQLSILGTSISRTTERKSSGFVQEDAVIRDYLKILPEVDSVSEQYCPIPNRPLPPQELSTQDNSCKNVGALLGIVEVPEKGIQEPLHYGVRQSGLQIIGSSAETRGLLASLIVQYALGGHDVYCVSGDYHSLRGLRQMLDDLKVTPAALIGPDDPEFLCYVIKSFQQQCSSDSALFVCDALDTWMEQNIREAAAQNILCELFASAESPSVNVIATAQKTLRGKLSQYFNTTLRSARSVSQDPLFSVSKRQLPVDGNFLAEGTILSALGIGPAVTAAELTPVSMPTRKPHCLPGGVARYEQLPSTVTLAEVPPVSLGSRTTSQITVRIGLGERRRAASLSLPLHEFTMVWGKRGTGKTSFFAALKALNTHLNFVQIDATKNPSVEEVLALIKHCQRQEPGILIIDNVHVLAPAAQQIIVEHRESFQHIFCAAPQEQKHLRPILASLTGAIRGVVLYPAHLSDLEVLAGAYLPPLLKTSGRVPPGRAVIAHGGKMSAVQIPLDSGYSDEG